MTDTAPLRRIRVLAGDFVEDYELMVPVQALEMIHQKDMAESKGVPMPPLPFQGDLQDAPPPNDARPMPPVPGMPPGAPPLVPPVPPGG